VQSAECHGSAVVFVTITQNHKKKHHKKKRVIVAKGSYAIAANQTATITVRLTGNGKQLLNQRHGTLHAMLTLAPLNGKPTTLPFTLKQAKHH
jgi:hypothetical protein